MEVTMSFWIFSKTRSKLWALLRKKKRLGIVVTADEIWNRLKATPKLDDEEREIIFQQLGRAFKFKGERNGFSS
jgi:hypothetical protein